MSDDFVTNFTAEDAREKIARKKDFEEYQKVKRKLSLNIQNAINEGAKFRCSICGKKVAEAAYEILAALELGYEVKGTRTQNGAVWADIYWDEEPTETVRVADNTKWATVDANTIGFISLK